MKTSIEKIDENLQVAFTKQNDINSDIKNALSNKVENEYFDANLQEVKDSITDLQSGIIDSIFINSPIPTQRGQYVVSEFGIYVNFKDSNNQPISVTEEEFTSGVVYLVFNGTHSHKVVVPIEANGEIKEGDNRAVSGQKVNENISPLKKEVFTFIDVGKVDSHRLIRENGSLASNSQYDCTTVIPVKLGDIGYFTGDEGNETIAVAGYNEKNTNTFVKAVLVGKGKKYKKERFVIDDPSINYIICAARNLNYPGTESVLEVVLENSIIKTHTNDINLLSEEIEKVVDDNNINTEVTKSEKGKVINTGNGLAVDISGQVYPDTEFSDFIAVMPNQKIKVTGWFGSQVGIAGYDSDKNYNSRLCDSSASSVFKKEYAFDFEITIPENVYYIRSCSKNSIDYKMSVCFNSSIKKEINRLNEEVEELKKTDNVKKMYLKKVNNSTFNLYVYNQNSKKYTEHTFIHAYKTNKINGIDVVTSDVWYPQSIIGDSKTIAQGNLNFIYMINAVGDKQGENGHVGAGHGCVVAKWTLFLADGKPFLPTDDFDILEIETFSLKYYADCYAIDKANSPSGENGIPFVDENNSPKIANNHALDATYYDNGRIEHRNKLYIKRDGTSFAQCHAAMNSCFRPYFDKVLVPNDLEFTINRHWVDNGVQIDKLGSNINTRTQSRIYCNEVTQLGADNYPYLLKNTILNMNNEKQKNSNLYFYYSSSPNWLKVYMQPVICTSNPENDPAKAEVFNNGDVIDILVKREIHV